MSYQQIFFFGTAAFELLMSVIAFATFIRDKRLAVKGAIRVKEKTLLAMAALFGAPGALLGRIAAHHKTEKAYFSIVIVFSLILQAALLVYLGYLAFLM